MARLNADVFDWWGSGPKQSAISDIVYEYAKTVTGQEFEKDMVAGVGPKGIMFKNGSVLAWPSLEHWNVAECILTPSNYSGWGGGPVARGGVVWFDPGFGKTQYTPSPAVEASIRYSSKDQEILDILYGKSESWKSLKGQIDILDSLE